MYDFIEAGNTNSSKTYLMMEFINGGDMFSHIRRARRLPADRVKFYAAEILLAIEHMHLNGVIYRDLKPENVMINKDGHIKIIDFGLCKN